jgi:hypothetical protein
MQFSMMTGWIYSVVRMVRGEGKSHTKWHANRGVACDLDCAEMDSQTLGPACRSSQNTVKMPVGIRVLISLRVNWVLRASQNLARLVARMIVAQKERSGFRGDGGVVESEPGMRPSDVPLGSVATSKLRLLEAISVFMALITYALAGSTFAATIKQVTKPILLYNTYECAVPFERLKTPEDAIAAINGSAACQRQFSCGKGDGSFAETIGYTPNADLGDRTINGTVRYNSTINTDCKGGTYTQGGAGLNAYAYCPIAGGWGLVWDPSDLYAKVHTVTCERLVETSEPDTNTCVGNPTSVTN